MKFEVMWIDRHIVENETLHSVYGTSNYEIYVSQLVLRVLRQKDNMKASEKENYYYEL